MIKTSLIFILLLYFFSPLYAQNWKTVALNDTTYFNGGPFTGEFTGGLTTYLGFLRVTWLDSAKLVNGDSSFYFYKTVRNLGYPQCIDTFAASWLGRKFIRNSAGIEYYFNSLNDTITVKTAAGINDSWTIAKNNIGVTLMATITQEGIQLVDGTPDSVKTISLQAYQNNVQVANWYNNKILQLSKNHGWLQTLDMYRFPNDLHSIQFQGPGTIIDSSQHLRISKLISHVDFPIDITSKYAPGNEWIFEIKDGGYNPQTNVYYEHDSIAGLSPLSVNIFAVTILTRTRQLSWYNAGPPNYQWVSQSTTNSYLHTENISAALTTPGLLHLHITPEYAPVPKTCTVLDPYAKKYFIDTTCNGAPVFRMLTSHPGWGMFYYNCWLAGGVPTNSKIEDTVLLSGFGLTSNLKIDDQGGSGPPSYDSSLSYYYIKLGNCIQGTKFDVLGVGDEQRMFGRNIGLTIYPNPAKDQFAVSVDQPLHNATASLFDITGRLMQKQPFPEKSLNLNTTGLAPGVYFVKLQTDSGSWTKKIVIEK